MKVILKQRKEKGYLHYYIVIDMSQDYVPLYLRAPFVGVHKDTV